MKIATTPICVRTIPAYLGPANVCSMKLPATTKTIVRPTTDARAVHAAARRSSIAASRRLPPIQDQVKLIRHPSIHPTTIRRPKSAKLPNPTPTNSNRSPNNRSHPRNQPAATVRQVNRATKWRPRKNTRIRMEMASGTKSICARRLPQGRSRMRGGATPRKRPRAEVHGLLKVHVVAARAAQWDQSVGLSCSASPERSLFSTEPGDANFFDQNADLAITPPAGVLQSRPSQQ